MGCGCSSAADCAVKEDRGTEVNLTGRTAERVTAPTATLLTAGDINHSASKIAERVNAPTATLLTAGDINLSAPKIAETPCNVLEHAPKINVYFASGEYVELAVYSEDKVWDLSRRLADLKDAGWAILLSGTEPLDGSLAASSIPVGQTVTAVLVLQDDWERPDRLSKTSREQIHQSLHMHGVICTRQADGNSIDEAFKQSTWGAFRGICQPIQDFIITVFELAGQRYVEFNFGMGDNGFGSVHAVGSVDAILRYDDGSWEPLVEPWKDVHQNVCCDKCGCNPIIGIRYKSLEQDDYDLCEACFASEERCMDAWVQPSREDDKKLRKPALEDDDGDDDDDDEDDEDDDEDDGLPPLFDALVKAIKANKVAKYGCDWHGMGEITG